jgi:HK97 family phage major capsid protein
MPKTAIPTTQAEFEEVLSDTKKLEALFGSGEFGPFIQSYAETMKAKDQSIADQVREQTEIVLADMLKTNRTDAKRLNLSPVDSKPSRYSALENKHAVGAPLNGKFPDLPTFVQCFLRDQKGREMATPELADSWRVLNTYQEKVGSDGGFLVPEEFRAELLRLSLESSVVRPRARVVPMSSATLSFPGIDSTTNVGSVYGGIVVYRTEEAAALVASQASFLKIKLEATKQTALATVTNELVNDAAGGFGMYIEQMFPEAIAFAEDVDFLKGTGVGEPLGALSTSNTALIAVAKETSQPAASIMWENVLKMYSRMLPSSLRTAVWIVTPDAFVQLATMALNVGVGGSAVWVPDAHGAPQLTLLGCPVILSEKAPGVLGAQGDISFVDLNYYLIGDRQQMTVDKSEHIGFRNDTTDFRVIQRNDGRPWLQSAITPQNGGPTMSPFVQLAVRS